MERAKKKEAHYIFHKTSRTSDYDMIYQERTRQDKTRNISTELKLIYFPVLKATFNCFSPECLFLWRNLFVIQHEENLSMSVLAYSSHVFYTPKHANFSLSLSFLHTHTENLSISAARSRDLLLHGVDGDGSPRQLTSPNFSIANLLERGRAHGASEPCSGRL